MSVTKSDQAHVYRNAMESLVEEEVERQLQRLPTKLTNYLNITEVKAYALNRLPALYATSEKGWRQQRLRGKNDFGNQIATAVRQALAAIQRDPLRVATPLPNNDGEPETALQGLKELLNREEVSWRNLVETVEQTLIRAARGEITWRKRGATHKPYDWHDSRYRF